MYKAECELNVNGLKRAENHCINANLGGRMDHTIFISNGNESLQEAKDLIEAGEYSHIILACRTLEGDPNCYPLIHNKALQNVSR